MSYPDIRAWVPRNETVTFFSRKSAYVPSLFVLVPFAKTREYTLAPSRYTQSDASIPLIHVLLLLGRESESNTSDTEMNTWYD